MPSFFDNRYHILSGQQVPYLTHEIDESGDPKYYGFVNHLGSWVILRETTAGQIRYAVGKKDFPTSWTNRASLTYDYFNNLMLV